MAKFRKKPVVVDAVQLSLEMIEGNILHDRPLPTGVHVSSYETSPPPYRVVRFTCVVTTPNGNVQVEPGEWILTGVKGEHYPCKPDIFEATYEPAE